MCGLIDAIVLTSAEGAVATHPVRRGRRAPTNDSGLQIELKGNLAAMLSAATDATRSPETGDLELESDEKVCSPGKPIRHSR